MGDELSRSRRAILAGTRSVMLAGCLEGRETGDGGTNGSDDTPSEETGEDESDPELPLVANVEPEVVVDGLDTPWDLAFPVDGFLVTE